MDYRIFNMCTNVNAHDCAHGCVDMIRVCTESRLWEKNPLPHQRNQTCISSVVVWCSTNWATAPPLVRFSPVCKQHELQTPCNCHWEFYGPAYTTMLKHSTPVSHRHIGECPCGSLGRPLHQHAVVAGLIPWCHRGFFSQSTSSAGSLAVSVHPCVSSHAFTSERTLKIP